MGPTNLALVKLFQADQKLREAQARLEAAARNVRIQERRVNDLNEKAKLAQTTLREQQAKARQFELDLSARDAHIERLRTQQQNTKNNREYQAFLVEINTAKVDRGKVEDEAMKTIEAVEKLKAEATQVQQHAEAEKAKLETMKAQIGDTLASFQAEVDATRPQRDAAAAAVPGKIRDAFERLAEHHDGEAMAAISKPDRRREEYLCTACNMELARDVYNKLHTRDEVIYCPSCRRILYIPEDLSPELALGTAKPTIKRVTRPPKPKPGPRKPGGPDAPAAPGEAAQGPARPEVEIELRAKGKLGEVLSRAQGETVRSANAAGQTPVDCEVYVDDKLVGIYKGQTPAHLERAIKYYMGEAKLFGAVRVQAVPSEEEAQPPAETPAATATETPSPTASEAAPAIPAGGDGSPAAGETTHDTAGGAAATADAVPSPSGPSPSGPAQQPVEVTQPATADETPERPPGSNT